MKPLVKPFQMGSLMLPSNVFYAPLAGCSDFPFRFMSSKYRPGLVYCEMVKMDALIRNDQGTYHMLDYSPNMHPIGAQLCGSKAAMAAQAARIVEDLGFDVVDLNCGCPVDKVTKDGSGSGLLKQPARIGEIISNMVAAVKIPVTLKIRTGWDDDHINCEQITRIAEDAGATAICIHGRTREQGYRGTANWDYIKKCKALARTIKVIGNGDITDAASAKRMFEHTNCDAILIGRATMGQPWIAEDIIRSMEGLEPIQRDAEDYRQSLYEHFLITKNYHPPRRVVVDMRRVGCWYFKKSAGTRAFREQISRAQHPDQVCELIKTFPIGELVASDSLEGVTNDDCC